MFDVMKPGFRQIDFLAEKLQEQERGAIYNRRKSKVPHDNNFCCSKENSLLNKDQQPKRNKPPNQESTQKSNDDLLERPVIKRSDEDFISIGSAGDEKLIKRMNEKGVGLSKSEVIKEESKEEVQKKDKDEESTRKRKLGTRKKMKSRKRRYIQYTSEDDSDKDNDELRLYLTVAQDEEKEVDYEILDRKYPIKESNGQKRYFSTLMTVLSIFDREDLNAVYQLLRLNTKDEMPEDDKDEFWSSHQDWKIVSWKLHSSSGIHTLVTDTGLIIHMLVEKKYHLRKEVLKQMLKLKLESEQENTMALELIKFVRKILAELESEE
ncbi:hypothetical protein Tco_0997736 [Tanacetum coccineum]